jgi:hypothetical protein
MLIPPPGGSPVHPAITPSTEPQCQEFRSQLKQATADFAHLQTARHKLQRDESHGATKAQIKKDKQAVQTDAKAFAAAANRLWEQEFHMPAPLPPLSDLENPPVSHQKEMQDRVSSREQASIEERVKG